jgi:hypothetical protein
MSLIKKLFGIEENTRSRSFAPQRNKDAAQSVAGGKDRRKSVRYPADRRCRIYIHHPTSRMEIKGYVRDMSNGGMKFAAEEIPAASSVAPGMRGELRVDDATTMAFSVVQVSERKGTINCRFDNECPKFMIMKFLNSRG